VVNEIDLLLFYFNFIRLFFDFFISNFWFLMQPFLFAGQLGRAMTIKNFSPLYLFDFQFLETFLLQVLRFEDFWPLLQPFSNVSYASIFTKNYGSFSASPEASLYILSLVFPNSSASSTLILIALQQLQPKAIFNLKKFLRYLSLCTCFAAFYLSHS